MSRWSEFGFNPLCYLFNVRVWAKQSASALLRSKFSNHFDDSAAKSFCSVVSAWFLVSFLQLRGKEVYIFLFEPDTFPRQIWDLLLGVAPFSCSPPLSVTSSNVSTAGPVFQLGNISSRAGEDALTGAIWAPVCLRPLWLHNSRATFDASNRCIADVVQTRLQSRTIGKFQPTIAVSEW